VSTQPENLQELAAAYALGALEPAEARAFEQLLATSPEAQREVAEYREVGALLALGSGAAAPSADLKQRTIARAAAQKEARITPRSTSSSWVPWVALAASLMAVVGLALSWQGMKQELARRDTVIAAMQDSLTRRDSLLALRGRTLDALLDPSVSLIRMGTPGTPEPVVQLFWNRRLHQISAHAFQLKQLASNRTYQLWFIPKNGKPIPSVTFNSEPSGHALVEAIAVPADVELAAAAITEEPAGGSPQPTTTPFLVGTLVAEKT
jgi:anti-sigma-K factor RskA